jgi:Bifunctional DNA primase/polymerase, N-terminal
MTDGRATPLQFALRYAAIGWHTLPLVTKDKVPMGALVPHGCLDATIDPGKLRAWFADPERNIGLACGPSGIVVVDVDPRHDGDEEMRRIVAVHGKFPVTPVVYTGGGGWHAYFRAPVDSRGMAVPLRKQLAPGVDLQGVGKYVVAPPSVHPSGRPYMFATNARPSATPLAPMPPWLLALSTRPPEPSLPPPAPDPSDSLAKRAEAYVDKMAPAVAGSGGHGQTFAVARKLLQDFAVPESTAWGILLRYNARCQPPWSERELRHKLAQARVARVRAPVADRSRT